MNSHKTPRLSIGLPIYNGERYLVETIDSLLAQTFTDFELIISDNASTDASPDICRKYAEKDPRIRYCPSDDNRGAAWNFNNTVHLARGEFFKWAAYDDLHHPEFLEKCIDILDRNPSVVLCFSGTRFIDEDGQNLGEYKYPIDIWKASRRERFLHFSGTLHIVHEIFGVIRSDILRQTPLVGSYVGADIVLLGKLSLFGSFYQIPEQLFLHREHSERSARVTDGASGYTRWFNPAKSGRYAMPYWRRFFENGKSVVTHPMSFSEKSACLLELCRAANWNREGFSDDLLRVLKTLSKGG